MTKARFLLAIVGLVAFASVSGATRSASSASAAAPAAPAGVTGMALDASVVLSWQPVAGATSYAVYRGTTQGAITTPVTGAGGVTTTSFTDSTAVNGTTYYYVVRAASSGGESVNSLIVQATAAGKVCSTAGNPVVVENCRPGSAGWKTVNAGPVSAGGIEGYATASSINKGDSVDLKVNSGAGSTFRVEVFRSGYYQGAGGRLFSVIRNVSGTAQPACASDVSTGLVDCANWATSLTLTTTSAWPSGAYILHVVRNDNGSDYEILLVVRDDSRSSDLLYGVSFATYQAYNNYGGKSLYEYNSFGNITVAGSTRAVKVSYDRPYEQPRSDASHDWYDKTDYPQVYWLERSGYDVTYASNTDLDTQPALARNHRAYWSSSHDEYWSAGMRSSLTQARDAGVGVFFSGANGIFWKIRFEPSPTTGQAGRTQVCYKSTYSGPADPTGNPTGLWRDPQGANQPENALIGQMYVGDADNSIYPVVVTSAQGKDRVYRYTDLASIPAGESGTLGNLLGWEWDKRWANGQEPAGLVTLASSPATGEIWSAPYTLTNGTTTSNVTKYLAASGALVFSTGTNFWERGLALNDDGTGTPDTTVQQVTTNVLADMHARPATPAPDITLDSQGPPQVIGTAPGSGATGVPRTTAVTADFTRAMDPTTINGSTFTLTTSGGSAVAATVTYDATNARATLTPSARLAFSTTYTARVTTGAKATDGQALSAAVSWSFTTEQANPPSVTSTLPASGATGVSPQVRPRAVFSLSLDPATVTTSSFTLRRGTTGVAATVSYDDATKTATLSPTAALANGTTYTVSLSTAVTGADGSPLASAVSWSFTTAATPPAAPTVTGRTPASGATGVARDAVVTAVFSRAMDAATVTASTFTLATAGGASVAGTVAYNASTNTATLTPGSALAYGTSYTARLTTAVRALDGTPLAAAVSWSFSTLPPPPPPTVTAISPANGAGGVSRLAPVSATFSRAIDPATLTSSAFTVSAGGQALAGSVAYDSATRVATVQTTDPLPASATITARLDPGITSADGVPLGAATTWSFTTGACPCRLFAASATPSAVAQPTQDGRTGAGPWSYELGVKVQVDRAMELDSIRFYKSPGETGTHVGRVWSSAGTQLAQATFAGETASGWQQQALTTPIVLYPGNVYVVSVNANAFFVTTPSGLATQVTSGPLHTVDPADLNGVYGASAGTFPTESWNFSNYWVDVEVGNANLPPPTVTAKSPADGSSSASIYTTVAATFSRSMDATTISGSTFTLTGSGGASIPATVSYDNTGATATLTPSSPLATGTTYTAKLAASVAAADGTPLPAAVTWSFATAAAPPSAPTVTAQAPAPGSTLVAPSAPVTASFSRSMSPSSITTSSFTVVPSGGGQPVAATVSYDDGSKTATLQPTQQLAGSTTYTARLDTGIRAADGAPLASAVTWSFTTAACPCSLFSSVLAPASQGLSVVDGRTGAGPFTYELGVKVTVSQASDLTAIRFYKSPGETGTHVGRVWTSGGVQLGQVTFANETASGWQQQALGTPLALQAGSAYVVSVNANSFYVVTPAGLSSAAGSGPLSSVVGANGVYGASAGTFPASSYNSSNYFVDLSVTPGGGAQPLTVTSTSPSNNASSVARTTTVQATVSRRLNPSTVTSSSFTLSDPSGTQVPATVTYDDATTTATLTPSSPLAVSTTYTARLSTAILALDGTAFDSPVTWSFRTADATTTAFAVDAQTPASGATGVPRATTVTAHFSRGADPASITSSTFVLQDGSGNAVPASVSYDASSVTATLTPSSPLAATTAYTAKLTTGVRATDATPLPSTQWSFTTGSCPCSLFADSATPSSTGNPVKDGRSGSGPFSYELGVKISVTQASTLTAIRYYRDAAETGSHVANVWAADGTKLASVTFGSESGSGWQQQELSSPVALTAGSTYVVSVGLNNTYVVTGGGLASQITSGPLQSVVGSNGVFGASAGTFPTSSWNSSNYFVDVVVQ